MSESEGIHGNSANGRQRNGLQRFSPPARGLRPHDRLPDHPSLLQTYVWQDYDLCPRFPVLNRFLAFWLEKLEGPLYSVIVAHSRLIKPAELRAIDGEFRLH